MDKERILLALQKGTLCLQGQFVRGSNYTFLTEVIYEDLTFQAVYKPVRGEQPLWDFPTGSLAKREVAAYLLSEALGWELVPPTIYRRRAELGIGSLQLFVPHKPEYHFFNFEDTDRERLRPTVLFDLLINNADRKGSHVLVGEDGHIWLIDHGVCFHVEEKLRTVLWDFAGQPIPEDLLTSVAALLTRLQDSQDLPLVFKPYLRVGEVRALAQRAAGLLAEPYFPIPRSDVRVYPWPPV